MVKKRNVAILCLSMVLAALLGCQATQRESVTVYVSEDRVFSEPILKDFEKETGIQVKAVYDTEESKSTGVMKKRTAKQTGAKNREANVFEGCHMSGKQNGADPAACAMRTGGATPETFSATC